MTGALKIGLILPEKRNSQRTKREQMVSVNMLK